MASSSSSVGRRKSRPGARFNILVKCWMTAPVAKDRREPSPGEPSPGHPVRGPWALSIVACSPGICGTPRRVNLLARSSNPSRFTIIKPNSRIRCGFSKYSFRAGLNSATNSGSSSGRDAINVGSMEKYFIHHSRFDTLFPSINKG